MVENNSNNTIDSFFGLLDLKKDAVLGLDGHSIVLKTDDFVGVRNLVNSLHFVSVRSQPNATVAVGFFVEQTTRCFVRKYDPQTEEISPDPVDEATVANLLDQVQHQQIATSRVLEYKAIVSDYQAQQWREQTNYIGSSNILNKREITNGGKIVPGAYHPDEDEYDLAHDQQKPAIVDGKSIIYPNIPVVDPTLSLWKNKHPGTKRYLSQLTPSQRTSLFTKGNSTSEITTRLLEDVLSKYYDNQWQNLLGDLQLSYVLFLYLHCFSSLEHWKDLVACISLVEPTGIQAHAELYRAVLQALPTQIITMEKGFLDDIDEAGNNFLLPALRKLCRNLSKTDTLKSEEGAANFKNLLANRFPSSSFHDEEDNNLTITLIDDEADEDVMEDSDDDDAPVVVAAEEVQASLDRSSVVGKDARTDIPIRIQNTYPLLVAAIMPHEDILMTCARALDEQKDVSLVRQAASYLEQVEQNK